MTGRERDKELFNLLEQIKNDDASDTKVVIIADSYADKIMKDNEFAALTDNKKIYAASPRVSASLGNDRKVRFWLPYSEIIEYEDELQTREVLLSFQLLAVALTKGGEEDLEEIRKNILYGSDDTFTLHCKNGRNFVFSREIMSADELVIRDTRSLQYNRIQYVFTQKKFDTHMRIVNKDNIGHWRDNALDNEDIDFTDKVVIIGREDKECNDFLATLIECPECMSTPMQ